jgi:DNA invertase Pin-like site-specific DNA recombinase
MLGIYMRCSTNKQQTASQKRELKRWAESHADENISWYEDHFTGKTMERPGWVGLWKDCCEGRIQTIVCWRLDRLGRTAKGLITLRDELIARSLNLISLRDSLDLSTSSGRLMFGIIASVAEYETEVRRERQMAGIAAARERGKRIGGRKAGASNRKTRDVLPAVLALHKEGKRVSEIARATRLSRPTIYGLLQDRQR